MHAKKNLRGDHIVVGLKIRQINVRIITVDTAVLKRSSGFENYVPAGIRNRYMQPGAPRRQSDGEFVPGQICHIYNHLRNLKLLCSTLTPFREAWKRKNQIRTNEKIRLL